MRTARMLSATTGTALLFLASLLAGCSSAPDGSTTTTTSREQSRSTPATESTGGAGIPDGTWVREITSAEISSRGLELSPEELTSNYLADGAARVVLKTQGARWSLLVQDDAGEFEVGDLGDSTYDAEGRWIQSSDATGGAVLLVWEVTDEALTTSDLTTPGGQSISEDGAHLFLEGTWQRQG